jgi:hypothetical protein
LKAFHPIVAESAESIGTFNTGFDTVNLLRPTSPTLMPCLAIVWGRNMKLNTYQGALSIV